MTRVSAPHLRQRIGIARCALGTFLRVTDLGFWAHMDGFLTISRLRLFCSKKLEQSRVLLLHSAFISSTMEAPRIDPTPAPTGLSPWESSTIEVFIRAASLIGLPRSVGEIYGCLFCAQVAADL